MYFSSLAALLSALQWRPRSHFLSRQSTEDCKCPLLPNQPADRYWNKERTNFRFGYVTSQWTRFHQHSGSAGKAQFWQSWSCPGYAIGKDWIAAISDRHAPERGDRRHGRETNRRPDPFPRQAGINRAVARTGSRGAAVIRRCTFKRSGLLLGRNIRSLGIVCCASTAEPALNHDPPKVPTIDTTTACFSVPCAATIKETGYRLPLSEFCHGRLGSLAQLGSLLLTIKCIEAYWPPSNNDCVTVADMGDAVGKSFSGS